MISAAEPSAAKRVGHVRWWAWAVLWGMVVGAGPPQEPQPLKRISEEALPNAIWVHPKVISGGQPQAEAGFQALKRLGVRTIISVDGARPQVELAKKYGMRYVHLPFGYDGIPEEQAVRLAQAVHRLPGVIYIHCHHGRHRSPAAAAVACVGAGLIPPQRAREVLQVAGTSPHYRGLFRSVERARKLLPDALEQRPVRFPQVAKLPPLAEAMVHLEHTWSHLVLLQQNRWQLLPKHPDLTPPHEALMLWEHYTELLRMPEVKKRGQEFVHQMRRSQQLAEKLRRALTHRRGEEANRLMKQLDQACRKCHRQFRDQPGQSSYWKSGLGRS